MNPSHREIIALIRKAPKKYALQRKKFQAYHGTPHVYHGLDVAMQRGIAKEWLRSKPDLSFKEWLEVMNALNRGASYEEKVIAAHLLKMMNRYRRKLDPKVIEQWLDHMVGWAEVDSFCQFTFSAEELLSIWKEWTSLCKRLARSKNLNKKRASLVLLTKPIRDSNDERLKILALWVIDQLKKETDPLLTKAISWLLREMTKHHKHVVQMYLRANALPSFVVREVVRKMHTGKR